ncbi:MAG: polyphosphate kinase 1 [Actinomycetota bacterium]
MSAFDEHQHRYLNRELSWLDFDDRVLALAESAETPLLDRVKFLAIAHSNLDEFFQVRVAGIREQVAAGVTTRTPDGRTPKEVLTEINERVTRLVDDSDRLFHESLEPQLRDEGIIYADYESLSEQDRSWLDQQFHARLFPVLTPLAVDPAHPFPYISNLSLNLAVQVRAPRDRHTRFARVKIPPILPRFVQVPEGDEAERFVPLEQVIAANLHELFPGMQIVSHHPFRVTRNADLDIGTLGDDASDLVSEIEDRLTQQRYGRVVRLEVEDSIDDATLDLLVREMEANEIDVYRSRGPLGMAGLFAVAGVDRPELKWELFHGITQPVLADTTDMFSTLRERDVLLQHPYDSFHTSVGEFIWQAARDPKVLAIKQTIYRTATDSSIVQALIHAAEEGKQVVALVEVKARFDEENNIEWARHLEEAGVHVMYGVVGLKTHTKTTLVVRDEGDVIRRYSHVGTGNYHEGTARLYEDVGLLTSNAEIGADLSDLFNYLTGYSQQQDYRQLLVAPLQMRNRIIDMIRQEAGQLDGRIVMKLNSLVDPGIIDALYEASMAGARIDLIVRGICCLRPGVPGLSENIQVRSVVGRYLEHSRILRFGTKPRGRRYFIGSADMMPRNLDRRVEAIAPILDPQHKDRLEEVLDMLREDDVLAWELSSDGTWWKVPTEKGLDSHLRLAELTTELAGQQRPSSDEVTVE